MKGKAQYEQRIERKISGIIEGNIDLKKFRNFMLANDDSLTTIYTYLTVVKNFLEVVGKRPDQLNLNDFTEYLLLKKRAESNESFTSSYKIGIYHALKKYGNYLKLHHILEENPMDKIKRPSMHESEKTILKRENGVLNKEEIKEYLEAVEQNLKRDPIWGERDKAIIKIFLGTGIRNSAMYKLDLSSINFKDNTLAVTDKESIVNIHILSEPVMETIKEWIKKREKILDGRKEDALFISNRKTRLSQKAIFNVIKKYSKVIKGKKISPHKLRATYGTQLYEATKDIYFVQKCMHHANPKTTELYIREQRNKTEEAASIMEKLL